MKKITAVIIDDEKGVRNVIRELLTKLCPEVNILGEADNVESAYKLITDKNPELVLLDVEMPGGSGFTILEKLGSINFRTVFITAYDQYALRAIKFSALDYILKPIDSEELVSAIRKYDDNRSFNADIKTLLTNLKTREGFKKIAIPSTGKVQYLDIDEIVRCESEGSYTYIFRLGKDKLLSSKSIKEYEELLRTQGFFRIHRSHLINLKMVTEYSKNERDRIIMKDGSEVEVSRKKRTEFIEAMYKSYL